MSELVRDNPGRGDRWSGLLGMMLGAAVVLAVLNGAGCTQSESAGWAQDSPVLQPESTPGTRVNLGVTRE